MKNAAAELEAFYAFGQGLISQGDADSLEEVLVAWDSEMERESINAAIREGIADVDAGRTRPASEVIAELRQKLELDEL